MRKKKEHYLMGDRRFKKGQLVQHFKREGLDIGTDEYVYEIIGEAIHSETREKMMVYRAMYGSKELYVRPYDMFMSEVDHEKYPDVKQKYRFEPVFDFAFSGDETGIRKFDNDGKLIAEITFPETAPGVYTIDHTFVDDSLRGQGMAGTLVQLAVDEIQRREGEIAATCSYAKKWLEENNYEFK